MSEHGLNRTCREVCPLPSDQEISDSHQNFINHKVGPKVPRHHLALIAAAATDCEVNSREQI